MAKRASTGSALRASAWSGVSRPTVGVGSVCPEPVDEGRPLARGRGLNSVARGLATGLGVAVCRSRREEGARVEHIIKGDTVSEVLKYVEFEPEMLMGKLRRDVEQAVNANRMEDPQAGRLLRFYEEALQGYTYLEDPNAD